MNSIFLSQIPMETDQALASWRFLDPATRGIVLIFGSIGVVTLAVLTWAVFFRKKGRRRRKHHHEHSHSPRPDEVPEILKDEGFSSSQERRRHRRHSRRRHRPRNPTLAETGGLPPVRQDSPPEPQA
jgi:hypothetical protein